MKTQVTISLLFGLLLLNLTVAFADPVAFGHFTTEQINLINEHAYGASPVQITSTSARGIY